MYSFKVEYQYNARLDGINGVFEGMCFISVANFEDVESLISQLAKIARRCTSFQFTFILYDTNRSNDKALGRITEYYQDGKSCLRFIAWDAANSCDIDIAETAKKHIKVFVLRMIDKYNRETEGKEV